VSIQNRQRARNLLRRQTEQEQFVWRNLRTRRFADFKFRRQFPLGNYIVDFICLERRVILKLEGGQHGEPDQTLYDAARDAWLRSQGFKVWRFWNHHVMSEWEMIADTLWDELQRSPSPPTPLSPRPACRSRPRAIRANSPISTQAPSRNRVYWR
jgi:very-short-patch-repair endonuclease